MKKIATPDHLTARLRLLTTSRNVAKAERRVVRAVRRWFKHAGSDVPASAGARALTEWQQRERSLHGYLIVACGLDMEARADYRRAQQAAHRARDRRRRAGQRASWEVGQ